MQARIQQLSKHVPDKRIHNYAFSTQAIIGRGSYGVVYIGRNIDSGQTVAIKAIAFQQYSADNQALLQKEIDIMKDLDCPNIVRLIDVITTANNCYIISELCTGGDLKEYMKRSVIGPIEESAATKILIQILRGILQSFKRGIIHRDLKPANILVANNNIFKIADFGFAKRFDKLDEDLMTSLVGTPLYMSPQVLLRKQYTSKCDVWSIGLIFYEMIEGKTPWNVRDILDLVNKQRNQKIAFSKKISKPAQQFITGCLAYEENNRFGWEQVFTHPLFENAFERQPKKETIQQVQPQPQNPQAQAQAQIQPLQSFTELKLITLLEQELLKIVTSFNALTTNLIKVFSQTQPSQQLQQMISNQQQKAIIQPLKPQAQQFSNTQNLTPQEAKQNKSMQIIPNVSPSDDKIKRNTISPLQLHVDNRQVQLIKGKHYLKTHASPQNEEENKNNVSNQKITSCQTQPNTQKKDRTVSVVHHKVESQQTTSRYSDNKQCREDQYKSERNYCPPKHLYQHSDPKFLFHRQSSENDEFTINRMLIQNQIEFLLFLKKLREQLLEFYGNYSSQVSTVEKLSFILLKNVMIKTTDIKSNLIDKQINILDLRDFEHFRMTESFRNLEKSILEIHFETFNQFQETFLHLNENLNLVMQDTDFLEIFNNNFEYSIHFVKFAYNLTAQFIRSFLYDQVLECSNVKIVNFTFLLGQLAQYLQQMSFSPNDVNKLLSNCRSFKEDFRLKRVECLNLMEKLIVKYN
ncbi:unnamed protein product (macronuclear) [Paramecium tetraurelia]|uniref:Protein kinase domain-containing protein n=1 Tax=Paramecium tetraurelia TaxID=5888 RepID=A0BUC3_PARTE|nr:uncharacterized protein GSPATT00032372001 [Paramecium tetraurelia]CAK62140.1 unnamed protein product [Paramecium tetraurelia]|eukprot:XP_001429538.1 hypothetical protein (macronuclear) [Paramecium tetraurelia strain d4-2]